MENKLLTKHTHWRKKDVASLAITYVANVLLFMGLFIGLFYFRVGAGQEFKTFIQDGKMLLKLFVLLGLTLSAMFLYFYFEERDFLRQAVNSEMLFLILQVSLCICFVIEKYLNIYIRPLALVAVLTLFLTNSRTAVFMTFFFTTLLFTFDKFSGITSDLAHLEQAIFPIITLASGVIAIYVMKDIYSRFKLMVFSLFVSLPCLVCVIALSIGQPVNSWYEDFLASLCSGPISVACFIIILPVFEFLFKKLTCFKLAELTDHKAKYIKKMIIQSPGTFNHALVVSNLAEACATAIGEDALLARTCAYYHDIGKLRRPEFFKENQISEANPHDDLTPELSANIIKSHTVDGYQYALKNRLPKEVADVAREHHGTMPILYFYDKAKKFTDGEVSLAEYSYGGPKPQTKIACILMIVDSCEALARTLSDRSRENVAKAVKKVVRDRMQFGQFDECEITLKELDIITHTVINSLSGVYHSRIEYPKVSIEDLEREESIREE